MEKNIEKYHLKPNQKQIINSNDDFCFIALQKDILVQIDKVSFMMHPSDYVFLKPHQSALLFVGDFQKELDIYVARLPLKLLDSISSQSCSLIEKFNFIPYSSMVVRGDNEKSLLLKNIMKSIYQSYDDISIGQDIYIHGLVCAMVIIFLRECIAHDKIHQTNKSKKFVVDDIFKYVSLHLTEDLSLKQLEERFYISKEHISRVFKQTTGLTLHSYITKKRIDLAKEYLLAGKSVYEIYELCGFGSYNHFFKAFKKECEMTPKQYYKQFHK